MTGQSCEVKVRSKQTMGNESEITEEVYQGTYLDRGAKKFLSYKRTTEDGSVDCLLTIGAGKITMSQTGSLKSKLEFVPGQTTENTYGTPMGNMTIPVFTRRLSVYDKKETIDIMIDYDIAMGDAIVTMMEITVTLK